jgi:metal-responsive CopG/Arc/MetJ family transcriptional regulator
VKTTVNIPDELMREVRRLAADRSVTLSDLIRQGLHAVLAESTDLPPIPHAELGEPRIDLDDRAQLWDAVYG